MVALLLGGAPAPSLDAQALGETHVLIVSGIPGEPRFANAFHEQARGLASALVVRHGVPRERVTLLAADPSRDPSWISARATKPEISKALARIRLAAAPDDRLLLVLIGHGSGSGANARINIPGPDLSAGELARELASFAPRTVAVVNTASASGDFASVLAGDNRIIITATASAQERNETIFGEHFVAAFTGDGADADKDGRLSLLEAYRYAQREVQRVYERDNRLLTEHARLEDDGDGRGTASPRDESGDGALARRFVFGGGVVAALAASDTVLAGLLRQRAALEQRVEALRARKDGMDAATYEHELETLLVKLAEVDQAARARGGKP
ncbi:MAG TPA: hypothetical protein VMM77_05410 [Gemmatimonadaceae bacterium]|nr:hypothetical protein [Gemmatimonadaceae bacterium]